LVTDKGSAGQRIFDNVTSCTVGFLILPFYATLQSIIIIAEIEKGRAISDPAFLFFENLFCLLS
jgi:hypothetical protein